MRFAGPGDRLFHGMVTDERHSPRFALLRSLATPVSATYGLVTAFRNRLFDLGALSSLRPRCRVVSVGNLTVGGTGKTPMVAWLGDFLTDAGWRVAMVSRGYGGTCGERVVVVSDGKGVGADIRISGDEAQLLARRLPHVPILCCADRFRAVTAAVETFQSDVVILDDGFQHRRVARDLDLVLLDARNPFGNGRLFPRGPLRERPSSLRRAHLLVLSRFDGSPQAEANRHELARRWPEKAMFIAAHRPVRLFEAATGRERALATLRDIRAAAFAGIARPEDFFRTLGGLGMKVVYGCALPDHYALSPALLHAVLREGTPHQPELWLTTEKDWVRLPRALPPAMNLWVLEVALDFGEENSLFRTLVLRTLEGKR